MREGSGAGLLAGLRVLEIGDGIAIRYCGRLMAALGAEVRAAPGGSQAGEPAPEVFARWLDAGKRAAPDILAGLNGPAPAELVLCGQDAVDVATADLAIARAGASAIRIGITWFGETGPYAGWRGGEPVVAAMAGLAYGFGRPEGPPVLAQGRAAQALAGVNAFIGGLAALMGGAERPRAVDVTVLEAALCLTEPGAVAAAADPLVRAARGGVNRFSPVYPSSIYPTLDGAVGVTALTPAQWLGLCALIGREDLAHDPRYATSAGRLEHADAIDAALAPPLLTRPTDHWVRAGEAGRVPITPAPRPSELPGMDHWRGRGAFAAAEAGDPQGPTLPFRFRFDGVTAPRPSGSAAAPLSGVRVADFSMGWAGPLAARYLGDLGADVVKVESAARPDWWRGWEILEAQDPPLHELPRHFMAVNRSKRGVDLDLLSAEGRACAEAIIRSADVVIENHGPGVMDRLGLGQADQRRIHPGVISVSMPPFGKGGPLTGLRAYGSTVEQASGLPYVNGHADWVPSMQHVAYGDPVAGLYGAAAAIAALYGRDPLGGAEIDLCQVECVFQLGADAILADQIGPGVQRAGSRRPHMAPVAVVRCAGEDAWLAVAVEDDAGWARLCAELADPDLDPAWGLAERQTRADAIEAAIGAWAVRHPPETAARVLQAAGVGAGPVIPNHQLGADPHLEAAGFWVTLQRRYIGAHLAPCSPIRLNGARLAVRRPAPTLGEHTREVLSELALS